MAGVGVRSKGSSSDRDAVSERTALLSSHSTSGLRHSNKSSNTASEEQTADEEADEVLSKSRLAINVPGLEPESQGTASLLNPPPSPRADSSQATSKSPYLNNISRTRFWLIFSGVLTAYFVACFDSTIMVSSHPVITSYFHSSNSASWLSTAFLLTSTSFQPLFGRLSDTIGRKPPYVFTMALFMGATVWCAMAQSMTSFIVARAVCGLGAGGMMVLGSIITSDLVPIEIRGAYQSYLNIIFGISSALGAALGGLIADTFGWRWEFGLQVPLLALCLILVTLTIPKNLGLAEGAEKKSLWEAMKVFDFQGSILLTTSITFLILGLNLGGNVFPWTHPLVLSSLLIFSISCPLFIYVETHTKLPIMPLHFITRYPRAGLILSNGVGAVIMNAVLFNIPLYFQAVLLESATQSGLRLIIPTLSASLIGTATGFLISYTRRLKPFLVLGVVFFLGGTTALCFMRKGLPTWSYWLFLVPSSVGQGFMFPATFMAVLAVSEQKEQAVVTSTLVLWRSVGMVLGVAASSLVLQNALLHNLEKMVDGPDKDSVILKVRKSITAIATLEPVYREQVIDAYAASLRATFIMAAVLSVVAVCMTLPIRLPRLGRRKS